jgi:hypothetical protein
MKLKMFWGGGILYFTGYLENKHHPWLLYTSIDAKEAGLYFLTHLLYWAL